MMNMKRLSLLGFSCLTAMTLLMASAATLAAPNPQGQKTYKVGQTGPSGVGVVGYITANGLHGVEYYLGGCSDVDGQEWGFTSSYVQECMAGVAGNKVSNWAAATGGQLLFQYNPSLGYPSQNGEYWSSTGLESNANEAHVYCTPTAAETTDQNDVCYQAQVIDGTAWAVGGDSLGETYDAIPASVF